MISKIKLSVIFYFCHRKNSNSFSEIGFHRCSECRSEYILFNANNKIYISKHSFIYCSIFCTNYYLISQYGNKQLGYSFEVCVSAHVALRVLLAFSQPVNCIFRPIKMLNWLVVASKLHKP